MCGRYSIIDDLDAICSRFNCEIGEYDFDPMYNAAPGQMLPVVIASGSDKNRVQMMQWGLVPYWAKDKKSGGRMINARMETVAEKPAFRGPLQRQRCIVPSNGYYEWLKTDDEKIPYRIIKNDDSIFGFAGLWDTWAEPGQERLYTFTIVTTTPVSALQKLHNRMPLVLPVNMEESWLKGPDDKSIAGFAAFLNTLRPESDLSYYQVSTKVNSPYCNEAVCIEEVV